MFEVTLPELEPPPPPPPPIAVVGIALKVVLEPLFPGLPGAFTAAPPAPITIV
jgi:hypothetical protein